MAANWQRDNYQRYLLNIVALYRQRPDLKAYLEILLSIATIGIFVIFAIKPTIITIADLLTKINSEQLTSDQMDTKIKNLGLAQSAFTAEQNNIKLLNTAIPTGPDVPTYIRQIEGFIKKENVTTITLAASQVDLLSKAATPSGQSSSSLSAGFTLTATGNYAQLINLIQDIESLRRPSLINRLDFSINKDNPDAKALNLTLTAQTPYN